MLALLSRISPRTRHVRSAATLTLGIRREDKNQWERRVPLLPDHVERLVQDLGATVLVQPSMKRVVPDDKFEEAGAVLQEDLSSADIIVGVKEVPINDLIPDKTYLFFSHTYKGQKYNMPMLKAIMDKKIRLIDYELMKTRKESVCFLDGLNGLGHKLLSQGYGSPFLACGLSYMYRCLADARLDLVRTGQVIMDDGLPRQFGPMVFVFTGNGNVTKGALKMFKCLPHEWVKPQDLPALLANKDYDNKKVYGVRVDMQDYIVRKDGGAFSRQEYLSNPELYESVFHERIAPYASFISNGIFWDERYPRLLTKEQAKELAVQGRLRLLQLADISCDIGGSFEFMSHSTTIDSPFFTYDPFTGKHQTGIHAKGISVMSIDNLPTEMPLEASEYFGDALFNQVKHLVQGNFEHPVVKGAMITGNDGKLVERHQKLGELVQEYGQGATVTSSSRVLLLGSGYVSAPLVDYLLRSSHTSVTIASNSPTEAKSLSAGRQNAPTAHLDVSNPESLGKLVRDHDVVVSFVPATLHPTVAEHCITENKHLVTASYLSPAMKSFNARAKSQNLTFLNEIGLDPGIDHLTAMRAFHDVQSRGGKITSFTSWCGGLPAPEVSNNPLGYKFSWSPRGVLLAGLNSAQFKRDGKVTTIPGEMLMRSAVDVPIYPGFAFEGLPNRDSLGYLETYGLGDGSSLTNMFRGTLRYKGYTEMMGAFIELGLLNTTIRKDLEGKAWADVLAELVGVAAVPAEKNEWRELVQRTLKPYPTADASGRLERVMASLQWLGLFDKTHKVAPSPSILDAFCALLQKKLVYAEGERDLVVMHHIFGVEWANGKSQELTSTLVAYGDPEGYSAMAKTVGLPAAIATEMLLDGRIKERGVIAPVTREIYEPILEKLEREGVKFVEEFRG
ncbi:hypothetical protein BCR33DRAFT_757622 [Rhizoclosmatium globosum]|uniref:Uncharacterized protein n=1 Tax=Rhizoclosmatium globosum TaxID=329046 RepID=A0A1Y2CME4_9FUNG|nr:hypothetical protein BCR33DRAFT_757622 [Rhizoclosmatium globosum]|eukprot:ORY48201.1 hypothetical protein BCR33DRAFT_757622 [Rhizoclosmatium globosum]